MHLRQILPGLWLMAALACCPPPRVQADPASAARAVIQSIYAKQDAAYSRLDPDGSLIDYAPGYVEVDSNGKRFNLTETRRAQREGFAGMQSFTGKTTIQKITVWRRVATVNVIDNDVATETDPLSHQTIHLNSDIIGIDTWKKTAQGWLLTHFQLVSQGGIFTEKRTAPHASSSHSSLPAAKSSREPLAAGFLKAGRPRISP